MPSRYLKPNYITSPRIDAVDAEARDCWIRLLLVADDYGRFFGSPQLVASHCYPLDPDALACERMLTELVRVGLIVLYTVARKSYVQITQWKERSRSAAKFPDPPEGFEKTADDCWQTFADCEQLPADCLQDADNCNPRAHAGASPYALRLTPSSYAESKQPAGKPLTTANGIAFDVEAGWTGITDGDVKAWGEAFPAVAIKVELAKAREWAKDNPKNRKSNWRRFITRWLSRAQDKAPPVRRESAGGSSKVAL